MAPQPPAEATALLALMLLQDARRDARLDAAGDLVILEQQDRSLWDQGQIAEALPLVEESFRGGAGLFACRRRLPPCTVRLRVPKIPTGPRFYACMAFSNDCNLRPWFR